MSEPAKKIERPLSPHLFIYKWQLTMILSITHRFCGVALAIGTLMVAWLLIAAASGPAAFNIVHNFLGTPLGLFMMFGWSVALYYHMCNGVRHIFWDTVHLFELKNAYRAGYVVLLMTAVLTAVTWWKVLTP